MPPPMPRTTAETMTAAAPRPAPPPWRQPSGSPWPWPPAGASAEPRLALLREGRRALLEVRRAGGRRDEAALGLQLVLEGRGGLRLQQALRALAAARAPRAPGARDLDGPRDEAVGGDDLVEQPDGLRLVRADDLVAEEEA